MDIADQVCLRTESSEVRSRKLVKIVGITKSVLAGLGPAAARAEHIKTKYCLAQTQAVGGGEPAATRAGFSKLNKNVDFKAKQCRENVTKKYKNSLCFLKCHSSKCQKILLESSIREN